MKKNEFPKGWNTEQVERILNQCEPLLNEHAFKPTRRKVIEVPTELVPVVCRLIEDFESGSNVKASSPIRMSGAMTV
jgi:hypothetical protein